MERIKFLIIGAGPTGLGAAYRLREQGEHDYLILERNAWVGGLAASFQDDAGFTWDIGGHVLFSHYPYFDKAMQDAIPSDGWLEHDRESWIWICKNFIPYPFQNNIRFLPKEMMWECLQGLLKASERGANTTPRNFREWILASFGEGVANVFMEPYNFKVWAYPPELLNYHWIGERVATIDVSRILHNIIFEKTDASWGPNRTFRFPARGGTGAIWSGIADLVDRGKIRTNSQVRHINASKHEILTDHFEVIHYDYLLSTMPLDLFINEIRESPTSLKRLAGRLRHSTSNIIGLGFEGVPDERLAKKCWIYFPEEALPFYRLTVFSNYSPQNAPSKAHYSLMCEVSESPVKTVDREHVVEHTLQSLIDAGLIPESNKCVSKWSCIAPYGYPIPSLERNNILSEVIPFLDSIEAYSRGRFGGWKYEVSNQDHSFMQGVEWVNRILLNEREVTYRVDTAADPNMTLLKQKSVK